MIRAPDGLCRMIRSGLMEASVPMPIWGGSPLSYVDPPDLTMSPLRECGGNLVGCGDIMPPPDPRDDYWPSLGGVAPRSHRQAAVPTPTTNAFLFGSASTGSQTDVAGSMVSARMSTSPFKERGRPIRPPSLFPPTCLARGA